MSRHWAESIDKLGRTVHTRGAVDVIFGKRAAHVDIVPGGRLMVMTRDTYFVTNNQTGERLATVYGLERAKMLGDLYNEGTFR